MGDETTLMQRRNVEMATNEKIESMGFGVPIDGQENRARTIGSLAKSAAPVANAFGKDMQYRGEGI